MIIIAPNTRGCKMERIKYFPKLYLLSHYYRQVFKIVKNRICMANIPSVSNNQQLLLTPLLTPCCHRHTGNKPIRNAVAKETGLFTLKKNPASTD